MTWIVRLPLHSFGKGLSNLRLGQTRWHGDEPSMNQNASTVLVIDDDHSIAELIACFLARDKLRPVIALNGIDGLQQAQALLPSLIICDSCLPGLDGLEVIERLRGDSATAQIPIVLMSGHEAERFDGSGANAFLQKPFHMNEMVALARSFVTRPAPATAHESGHEALESAAERRCHSQAVLA